MELLALYPFSGLWNLHTLSDDISISIKVLFCWTTWWAKSWPLRIFTNVDRNLHFICCLSLPLDKFYNNLLLLLFVHFNNNFSRRRQLTPSIHLTATHSFRRLTADHRVHFCLFPLGWIWKRACVRIHTLVLLTTTSYLRRLYSYMSARLPRSGF